MPYRSRRRQIVTPAKRSLAARFGALPLLACYVALGLGVPAAVVMMLPKARALDTAAMEPGAVRQSLMMPAQSESDLYPVVQLADRQKLEESLRAAPPPVPLRLPPKTQLHIAASDPKAVVAGAQAPVEPTTEVAVLRPPSDAQARAAIEADGYRRVRVLDRMPDGRWRATGFRGNTEIALLVDDSGSVSSQ